jgi:hypothetical protein
MPLLISRIPIRTDIVATNTKHEWINDRVTPISATVTSFDTDGDGTGINVDSTTGFVAGDVLEIIGSDGASHTELLYVSSVDSATELTLTRDYGGSSGDTIETGDILKVVSRPQKEGSDATTALYNEPNTDYNYTEIFDETYSVTGTMQAIENYHTGDMFAYQQAQAMQRLAWKYNNSIIKGIRYNDTGNARRMSGGIFNLSSGGNVTSVSDAISLEVINDALEDILEDGNVKQSMLLACHPHQARKISRFNTSGTNPLTTIGAGTQIAGNRVTALIGDIPIMGGGQLLEIFADTNMPKDKIAILDLDKLSWVWMRDRAPTSYEEQQPAMADKLTGRIIGEGTLEMKNADHAHAILTDLTI